MTFIHELKCQISFLFLSKEFSKLLQVVGRASPLRYWEMIHSGLCPESTSLRPSLQLTKNTEATVHVMTGRNKGRFSSDT